MHEHQVITQHMNIFIWRDNYTSLNHTSSDSISLYNTYLNQTSLNHTFSNKLAVMYAISLTRLYMHVVPILDIRGMLLIDHPSLNQTDHECMKTN
jgi:hypothetical protein